MNNTITEIKNTLEKTNSRITEAEEQISELEDRMVEITEAEQNKKDTVHVCTLEYYSVIKKE